MSSSNKTIAKNTIMLYIRMILSMVISLYTSRVVLETLGVTDYGIFSVVGGVVTMFSFFNSTMSGAASRFLTFELGTGNVKKLKDTFSTAVILHFVIALCIVIICETIGMWLLNNKLVIPVEQKIAAQWVFHFSILSMFFNIIQVPYSASIIAHEKMGIFAYIEIANSILRLLIVYLLVVICINKLILYSILTCSISALILFIYICVCRYRFEECRVYVIWDKSIIKPMLSFSGWDLYGNISVMARTQGVNMLLNMWFGPIMNAASDIAARVQTIVLNLSTNISMAIRPQIIKSYSTSDYTRMLFLLQNGSRITFVLMLYFAVPLIIEAKYILNLWLGDVPDHTILLMRLSLLWNIAVSMTITLNYCVHATGYVKIVSICSGTLFLLIVPITYIMFKFGYPFWLPYLFNIITVIIASFFSSYTIKKFVTAFSFYKIVFKDLCKEWLVVFVLIGSIGYMSQQFDESPLRLVMVILVNTFITTVVGFYCIFPSDLRMKVIYILRKKLCKKV